MHVTKAKHQNTLVVPGLSPLHGCGSKFYTCSVPIAPTVSKFLTKYRCLLSLSVLSVPLLSLLLSQSKTPEKVDFVPH